jgi:hypothetical protein
MYGINDALEGRKTSGTRMSVAYRDWARAPASTFPVAPRKVENNRIRAHEYPNSRGARKEKIDAPEAALAPRFPRQGKHEIDTCLRTVQGRNRRDLIPGDFPGSEQITRLHIDQQRIISRWHCIKQHMDD